jgi:EAL domain-containing protein (putative c-di-GMP-specific phosphodiesterase class I)
VTSEVGFELARAITQNELELHYQPIFAIDGKSVHAVEALVRWKHPQQGLLPPQAFLPTAEREGLMHDLTAWVMREALLQASVWRRDGLTLRVAVNVAATDLRDPRFVRLLDRTLQMTSGTSGTSGFTAEIRADETDEASTTGVRELGARGIPIALDDVTSAAQLDSVMQWPLGTVKLGREITGRAAADTPAAEVAHSIAERTRERNIALVAVGVEDQATLDFMRALGCIAAQGYGLAKPMPSRAMVRWARKRG